jgi:hypothetical protein
MSYTSRRSIALGKRAPERTYRTFEEWQAEQLLDLRSPTERGIMIGTPVMWRHKDANVIVTDRAIVTAMSGDMLTLLVKDVRERTCDAHIREIVNNSENNRTSTFVNANQGAVGIASTEPGPSAV